MNSQLPPFQSLGDRLAGKPYEEVLITGVTPVMDRPLREWIRDAFVLRDDLAKRVVLRLGITVHPDCSYSQTLAELVPTDDLLTIVDAILQLHTDWENLERFRSELIPRGVGRQRMEAKSLGVLLRQLAEILMDSGSDLRIDLETHRLMRRVDETVVAAVVSTIQGASEKAGDHLRSAWAAAYGVSPDPDAAYREAVRAVEDLACPLVLQKQAAASKATLGTVIGELRGNSSGWALEIAGKNGTAQNGSQLVPLMELLWHGQVSRHAGGANNRRQTQLEGEAAVHLAATLVQWLSAGVLKRCHP